MAGTGEGRLPLDEAFQTIAYGCCGGRYSARLIHHFFNIIHTLVHDLSSAFTRRLI